MPWGVSGGKDSLFLLCALAELAQYYPKHFSVVAVTADPCFGGVEGDYSQIQALCDSLSIPYLIKRTYLGPLIFEERKEENPCSLCARMRRGILHNLCVEEGISKLALGHHFDDAVQTFFMNLFYGGKLGCFSPKTYLSRKKITVIRPPGVLRGAGDHRGGPAAGPACGEKRLPRPTASPPERTPPIWCASWKNSFLTCAPRCWEPCSEPTWTAGETLHLDISL